MKKMSILNLCNCFFCNQHILNVENNNDICVICMERNNKSSETYDFCCEKLLHKSCKLMWYYSFNFCPNCISNKLKYIREAKYPHSKINIFKMLTYDSISKNKIQDYYNEIKNYNSLIINSEEAMYYLTKVLNEI